jgi:hypothetical protein
MKLSGTLLVGVVVVAICVVLMQRPSTVIVQRDSPVQFSSVRKHPFDVYADPYHAPERTNPYLTRDDSFNQVGVLQGSGSLLPLFGRPSPTVRNKWEYYTMTQGLKMPVEYRHRVCGQHGCDEVSSKDSVHVPGVGKYDAMVYDTEQLRYVPRI